LENSLWLVPPLDLAVDRVRGLTAAHAEIGRWVVSGHSLGAALACRAVQSAPSAFSALVLLGTTHPKNGDDLSSLAMPVTKVYASNAGVAPAKVEIDVIVDTMPMCVLVGPTGIGCAQSQRQR
jgi:pimeloyl-ACP methyl ester carboxylesterase